MDIQLKNNRLLSEVFYYDISATRNKGLKKGLLEYKLLLKALLSAVDALENKDFEKFDALVGENACQIRAIKIAIISSQNNINLTTLKSRIYSAQLCVEKLLKDKTIDALMLSGITLKELLEKENFDVILTNDEMFVFLTFLLSLMKEPQPELLSSLCMIDKCAPHKLKIFGNEISSKFANTLVRKTRRLLAEDSVNFVREMAHSLNDPALIRMSSSEFTQGEDCRPCTPMFWTYKTLLKITHREKIPIIIKTKFIRRTEEKYVVVDEEILYFEPSVDFSTHSYSIVEPNNNDLKKPALIIEGFACLFETQTELFKIRWKNKIFQHSVIDIVLAGAADHRQYPESSINYSHIDEEFEKYKTLATENGFTLDNPTTFFIHHVYPLQVGKLFAPSYATEPLLMTP